MNINLKEISPKIDFLPNLKMFLRLRKLTFLESYLLLITFLNLLNLQLSPGYHPDSTISLTRLILFAFAKGIVYRLFFPISVGTILYDFIFDDTPALSNIMRHFIPMSRYQLPFSANFK